MSSRRYSGAFTDEHGRIRPITPRKITRAKTGLPMRLKSSPKLSETQDPLNEKITINGVTKQRREFLLDESRPGETKQLPSGVHTGGVKKIDGKVAKPLLGITKRIGEPDTFHETNEYRAIKALEDLPHIPKGVELTEIDGVPHLVRNDLLIIDDKLMRSIRREDLESIERSIREANERGWIVNDVIQLGWDEEHNEIVVYDWSASIQYDPGDRQAHDDHLIDRMWKDAGYEDYVKAREWGEYERSIYNFKQRPKDDPWLKYTYLSYARPPGLWLEAPKGSVKLSVTQDEPWKPLGVIYTPEPMSREKIESYELIPTAYYSMGGNSND